MAQAEVAMLREIKLQTSNKPEERTSTAMVNQPWQPPEWPFFKVNFDATYDKNSNRVGVGIVMRDSEGRLQACLTASKDQVFSVAQAERAALQRAMDMCLDMGMNQVVFEGDAKAIIKAVNSKEEDNSWCGQETDDLQQLMKFHPIWRLSFVYRSANGAAHSAAKVAIKESCERVWVEGGPMVVLDSILSDVSRFVTC